MEDNSGAKSWSDILKDIATNGVNASIDRFVGPTSAYEDPYQNGPRPGQNPGVESWAPVDNTPGEPVPTMNGFSNQQLALGGAGVLLLVGLVVFIARK